MPVNEIGSIANDGSLEVDEVVEVIMELVFDVAVALRSEIKFVNEASEVLFVNEMLELVLDEEIVLDVTLASAMIEDEELVLDVIVELEVVAVLEIVLVDNVVDTELIQLGVSPLLGKLIFLKPSTITPPTDTSSLAELTSVEVTVKVVL